MPIVDDAFDFGRIAATNAISDVYAMGGKPILALAIVGMPINKLPVATMQDILAGGAAVPRCRHPDCRRPFDRLAWSRSTAWWRWAWCTRTKCAATARRRPATC